MKNTTNIRRAIRYKDTGVDIDAGDRLVDRIKPMIERIRIPEAINDIGGFAGLCAVPSGFNSPILVSGTDGVGTKLEIAFVTGIHDTIGIDLVAMCINDVLTTGARPLFFLDYFATSSLNVDIAESVIRGIVEGCAQSGCMLLGGETAELPGMYSPGTYDLAGFAVGIVERSKILDGRNCCVDDVVIGVASSGLHSNGYSLVRAIVNKFVGDDLSYVIPSIGKNLATILLEPTRIYAKAVQELVLAIGCGLRAIGHITGGGIPGNLPRILSEGLGAEIDLRTFKRPLIFDWLAENGPVEESEMLRTFNVGVGLCIVVAPDVKKLALSVLAATGQEAWELGKIVSIPYNTTFEERVQFISD